MFIQINVIIYIIAVNIVMVKYLVNLLIAVEIFAYCIASKLTTCIILTGKYVNLNNDRYLTRDVIQLKPLEIAQDLDVHR